MPVATWGMAMIEDPQGGVLMIGGKANKTPTQAIYRLRHGGAQWELLRQKMSTPNCYMSALLIPEYHSTNCTLNQWL